MIRINLFPSHKTKKDKKIEKELALYFFILLLIFTSMFYINHILSSKIDYFNKIKQEKNRINTLLLIQVSILNKNRKKLENLKANIKTIQQIRKKQNLPVLYLYELVKHFIKNKIWINYISLSCGKRKSKMDIKGIALDNQVLAEYINSLRNSPYIQQVYLKKAIRRNIKGYELISFIFRIKTKSILTKIKHNSIEK